MMEIKDWLDKNNPYLWRFVYEATADGSMDTILIKLI